MRDAQTEVIRARVTPQVAALVRQAADLELSDLSEWIRRTLTRGARETIRRAEKRQEKEAQKRAG